MLKRKIIIDPGHGGVDRSNTGASGKYIEADGNLSFSLFLKNFLHEHFVVTLTREKDETVTLTNRGEMAKGADMFLSVHSDMGPSKAGGVTVFGSVKLNNRDIGEKIGRATAEAMGIHFRGFIQRESDKYPGQDYYTVIGTAQRVGCPVVLLLERGFHSNPVEEKLLLDENIVRNSALAVAREIKKYYSIEDEPLKVGKIFKDVEENKWSTKYIKAAKELEFISGYPDGTFGPMEPLTREEAAVLMVKLYEKITGKKVVK